MTSVGAVAEQLAAAARRLSNLQQEADRVEQSARSRALVVQSRDRAVTRFGFLQEAVNDGRVPASTIPVKAVADAAAAAERALAAGSDELVAKTAEASQKAADLADVLRAVASSSWRSLVVGLNLAERRALVEALGHVPQYRAHASSLLSMLSSLDSQMRADFVTAADYRLFKETLLEFEVAYEQLKIAESPDVENFLRKFAMGVATLAHLTDEAHEWIREQGIEASFHIRPAR